jgi:hypothetical protein
VKLRSTFRPLIAARGKRSAIPLAIVKTMIDVPIKMLWTVIPRARADEDPALEPFRPVIAVGRAIVGRCLVISVRANRRASHGHPEARGSAPV